MPRAGRGYAFDPRKIGRIRTTIRISVTTGQIGFELTHLRRQSLCRARARYHALPGARAMAAHPLFHTRRGGIDPWERP